MYAIREGYQGAVDGAEAGGITRLRAADPEELRAFSWLPNAVADGVWEALHGIPVGGPG